MIEFAAGLDLSPSGATRAADRLVTDGLAVRTVCKNDKRSHLLSATREGRGVQRTLMQSRLDIVSQALGGFDQAERVALVDLIERFIAELDAAVCIKTDAQAIPEGSESPIAHDTELNQRVGGTQRSPQPDGPQS